MKLIFNELSINGQFSDVDEFIEYTVHIMKKILDVCTEKRIPILKKMDIYSSMITKENNFSELLQMKNNTVMTLLKNVIIQLSFEEPYWDERDETIQSKDNVCYEYPGKNAEPNCMTEAIERRVGLLSFPDPVYKGEAIECSRNGTKIQVSNIRNVEDLLNECLKKGPNEIRYVMEHFPFQKRVEFFEVNEKCYAEEALLDNYLTCDDIRQIMCRIGNLIEDKGNGKKTHWWDNISKDIFEYRVSVSGGREFRVFFLWMDKLIFLNGFIKKPEILHSEK